MSVSAASELTYEQRARIRSHLNPRHLELIVLPTEKCNFRCTYCYEDFKIGKMRPEVVDSLKALIRERSEDLSVLQLNWFGGEPLLAADIVLDVSSYAKEICEAEGISFFSNATTNAYQLDLAMLTKLNAAGVNSFQITIDGEKDLHDKTRVLGSGAGTYDRIMANLRAAKASNLDLDIMLRLHITKQNLDSIERAYEGLKGEFGGDRRFRFFMKAIENLGGPASVLDSVPDKTDVLSIQARVGRLLAESERAGSEADAQICYAARPNSFVIRADGSVGKCTVILNSERNKLGRLGPDGRMSVDLDKLRGWMKGFETFDLGALQCPVDALNFWN